MSPLKIWGDPVSGNCLKVKWTADFLGVPYAWTNVDVRKGETRAPEFLAINPAGQVPVVAFPDGRIVAQSNAIILHLTEINGGDLIPRDSAARARVYERLFWEQNSHEPSIAARRFQKTFLNRPDTEIDPQLFVKGSAALALMDAALERDVWIAGGTFSVADIALVAYTRVAHEGGFDLRTYPRVRGWVARVEATLGLSPAQGAL